MVFLALLFLFGLLLLPLVAATCDDELAGAAQPARFLSATALLAGMALLLFRLLPLWAELALLALLFLILLTPWALMASSALLPFLLLGAATWHAEALLALSILSLLGLAPLLAQQRWRPTLRRSARVSIPFILLTILLLLAALF